MDATAIKQLGEIHWWIGDKLPMLKRRQSMTEQLARVYVGLGTPAKMVPSEWEGKFSSPEEARQRARELAGKFQQDRPGTNNLSKEWLDIFPQEVWAEIAANKHDPDFAEEFIKSLGPEKSGALYALLGSLPEDAGGRERDFAAMMATASHRGVFDENWINRFNAPSDVNGRYSTQSCFDLFNQLIKENPAEYPGPWAASTLVNLGKMLPSALSGYTADGYIDIFVKITKNPEALQQLLADERTAENILSMRYMADLRVRQAFTEGLRGALDQRTGANLEAAWANVIKFGGADEFQSLLAMDHELASAFADGFLPYLNFAGYLQAVEYDRTFDRGLIDGVPEPSGPRLSSDVNAAQVQDFLGGLLRHGDIGLKMGQEAGALLNEAVEHVDFGEALRGKTLEEQLATSMGVFALIGGGYQSAEFNEADEKESRDFWIGVAAGTLVGRFLPVPLDSATAKEFVKSVAGQGASDFISKWVDGAGVDPDKETDGLSDPTWAAVNLALSKSGAVAESDRDDVSEQMRILVKAMIEEARDMQNPPK